jgi:hypothetical protein
MPAPAQACPQNLCISPPRHFFGYEYGSVIMITFIIGQRNSAFQKALDAALLNAGEIERVRANPETILRTIEDIQTASLFGGKKTFVISGVIEDDDTKDLFWENGSQLKTAPHDVVILAETLLAADTKKAEAVGTVHKILEKEKKIRAFDPFVLGNAFANGDKKQSWIYLQEAIHGGGEMEPTHGIIWWKLKDLVQKKSLYSQAQMRTMARDLVSVYHESRLGGLNLGERLELFFLNLPSVK